MRLGAKFGAVVACTLTVVACGNTGDTKATSPATATTTSGPVAPAIVSPKALDVGSFPTTPRPPLGTAGTPERGMLVDAQHMADFVVGPWDVDPSLIDPYLESFYVLNSPTGLLQLGPEGIAAAAGRHRFVNGFGSAREAPEKRAMVNVVLRFADPDEAAAASVEMGEAVAKQPIQGATPTAAPIPGHPDAVALTYPFTRQGSSQTSAAVRSFTPHGPYVLMQFVQTTEGVDAAAGLVAKAIDAQGPLIDEFKATDPAALATVPLDPTGLLARTLPVASGASMAKNAVYGSRGAMHMQSDPIASGKLFKDTGISDVAMAKTNVYEAKDASAAVTVINAFSKEIGAEGNKPADGIHALPESHCLQYSTGFYCVAPAGRYAIEARGEQLREAQQLLAAQYVVLTAH
jgi:hypothetical protein